MDRIQQAAILAFCKQIRSSLDMIEEMVILQGGQGVGTMSPTPQPTAQPVGDDLEDKEEEKLGKFFIEERAKFEANDTTLRNMWAAGVNGQSSVNQEG